MSLICRLRGKSHGADGIKAAAEIERLRLPDEIKAELIWCRDNGNTGPRTHALLVELCNRLAMPNVKVRGAEPRFSAERPS